MKTKDIIDRTGIDRETLRFYESKGLLPDSKRSDAGHRIYRDNTIERLKFILTAKEAGLTLSEIKELIDLQQKKSPCRKSRDMIKIKKYEISDRILALKKMDKILTRFISECEKNGEIGLDKPCHFSFEDCCN